MRERLRDDPSDPRPVGDDTQGSPTTRAAGSAWAGWGGPRIDGRAALEGILFVLVTGCRRRDLPPQLGRRSGHTAWRRVREWQGVGVWDRLHQLVLDELAETELLDWSRARIDGVAVRSKKG